MKYNIFFKLFTFIFIFLIFAFPVFAEVKETNILSKVIIEEAENNSYRLNLIFNEKFTGNAFIQKGQQGSYFVYIPETIMSPKNTKVIYKNKNDKQNIKINIEEKPFIKDRSQSNYVRLSVDVSKDYSLRLLAKTIDQEREILPLKYFNINSLILTILLGIFIFLSLRIIRMAKLNKTTTSYTSFPINYMDSMQELKNHLTTEMQYEKPILQKVNIKKTLKSADCDSFSCFDIPLVDDTIQQEYEFKSTLKQTSNLLKEKTAKSKQTNPMSRNYAEDSSELALPVVEDLPMKQPQKEKKEENKTPELLSELHITPTKGFYLTTVDDTFALFGYVGDKVFLLQKFSDLTQINLQARFYDRNTNSDTYIVRLDTYKAMVEISDTGMKELAVL